MCEYWHMVFTTVLFYFLCSISGFAVWCIAVWVSEGIKDWSKISSGTGAILRELTMIFIAGISGGLPRPLFLGKNPGMWEASFL